VSAKKENDMTLRITPIGSCRIATPLNLCAGDLGYRVNRTGGYGFTHSAAEAVQQARILFGGELPPADIWPLISRRDVAGAGALEPHEPSDVYVVEISSAKEITVDGWCVQLNYMQAVFPEFFADPARVRAFWQAAKGGDQALMDLTLQGRPEPERSLLRRVRMRLVTQEGLREQVEELKRLLPAVFFVTHVNARTPKGGRIRSRSDLIGLVERVLRGTGDPVYNPTSDMEAFGQERAIEDHSDSLAHFTEPFSRVLVRRWMECGLADLIARQISASGRDPDLLLSLLSRLEGEGLSDASKRVLMVLLQGHRGHADVDRLALSRLLEGGDTEAALRLSGDISPDLIRPEQAAALISAAQRAGASDEARALLARHSDARAHLPLEALLQLLRPLEGVPLLLGQEGDAAEDLLEHLSAIWPLEDVLNVLNGLPETRIPTSGIRLIEDLVRKVPLRAGDPVILAAVAASDRFGLTSQEAERLRRTLRNRALPEVRAAADQPDPAGLEDWCRRLEPVLRTVPEASLLLGRRLFSEGDGAGALRVLEPLSAAFPDRADVALLVMRSALICEDLPLLESAATLLSGIFPEEKDRIGEEARQRLKELPRRAYRVAAREEDPVAAIRLYRIAERDPDLKGSALARIGSCRKNILVEVKRLLRDRDEKVTRLIAPALTLFPDDHDLLRLAARSHARGRRYGEALRLWEKVAEQDPEDGVALEEVRRFRARLSDASGEVQA
jgi:tetratricopeptide (TPR) repeat protein